MKKIFIILILFTAIFFRVYQLDNVPSHPSLDEVSIGYNAFSILKTGADEYGTKYPLLLRAYDDWRPALYVYLVMPVVTLLDLNVFAVRLPSVLLSILTVFLAYLLTKEILNTKFKTDIKISESNKSSLFVHQKIELIALFVAFLLAINPWHIYISRLGHEVNLAFSAFIFGLYFFFKHINRVDNKKLNILYNSNLIMSSVFFGLSFNSYQSTKIVIPLILVLLFILYYKKLLIDRKILFLSFFVGLIVILPVLFETLKPQGLIRFQGTNIFSTSQELTEISAERIYYDRQENNYLGMLFDNRRIEYFLLFTRAYLSHLNPSWLFTYQNGEIFKIPSFGFFHLFEFFLIILGIIFLIKKEEINIKIKIFFFFWFFITILPGALTTGYPHGMRIYNILPLPQIIGALGLLFIINLISSYSKLRYTSLVLFITIITFSIFWLMNAYFVNFKRELSYQFQDGVVQALSYAKNNEGLYKKIVVSNKNYLSQSYMFYLFLNKYDPLLYQHTGGTISGGYNESHKIGKYVFENPNNLEKDTLYIINPGEIAENELKIILKMKFNNKKESIWVAQAN